MAAKPGGGPVAGAVVGGDRRACAEGRGKDKKKVEQCCAEAATATAPLDAVGGEAWAWGRVSDRGRDREISDSCLRQAERLSCLAAPQKEDRRCRLGCPRRADRRERKYRVGLNTVWLGACYTSRSIPLVSDVDGPMMRRYYGLCMSNEI